MSNQTPIIFSLIETPHFPKVSHLFAQKGYEERQLFSARKVINALKKTKPDIIVAQFHYLYESDYASCHVSNLDSIISTLQKYGHQPRFILFTSKHDQPFISKLSDHYQGFAKSIDSVVMPIRNEEQLISLL